MEHDDNFLRHHEQRPARIDIYVDGSWLYKGKQNPAEAGGWGCVVVETLASGSIQTWTPSGPTPPEVTSSSGAEISAAIHALTAVKLREEQRPGNQPMPQVVLHTDQVGWKKTIENYRADPGCSIKDELKTLARLTIALDAQLAYASHNKGSSQDKATDSAYMELPHDLASHEAWRQRVEKQNGKLGLGPNEIVLKTPEERDKFLNRAFPRSRPPREK